MPRTIALFLSLFFSFSAFGLVTLQVVPPETMSSDLRATWLVIATNSGLGDVKGLEFQTWTSASIVSMPADACTRADSGPRVDARCVIDVPARSSRTLAFTAQYDRPTGRFPYYVSGGDTFLEYDETMFGRELLVTTTADSGPGSLRQAILDVSRECTDSREPCVVAFALDAPPAEGWFTIRLQTPLPAIVARTVFVDGRSQTRRHDSNPEGPEILLDGSGTREGHGLLFRSSLGRVTGLAIGGFRGNGIETNDGMASIRWNHLGMDPTGRTALPNGLRGVQVNDSTAHVYDNLLGGNARAGGFFWTWRDVWVRRNRVIGNGASGLFFHKPLQSRIAAFAQENVIAHNAHAGIGLSGAADGDFAMNTFLVNAGEPVDVGLDGRTPDNAPGLPGQGGRVGAPILLSARFDGRETIVTGRVAAHESNRTPINERVYVYASATPQEPGEVVAFLLGETRGSFAGGLFTARIPGDLRGRWVRAASVAAYVYNLDDFARGTSEVSAALPVE